MTVKPGRGGLAALGIFSGFCGERLLTAEVATKGRREREENDFYIHFICMHLLIPQ
jgi:hypothetical protein